MQPHPMYFIKHPNLNYLPHKKTEKNHQKSIKCSAIGLLILSIVLILVFGVGIILVFTIGLRPIYSTITTESSHLKNISIHFSLHTPCTCGCSSIEPTFHNRTEESARIINGETAREDAWPWQILLIIYDIYRQPITYCGASLITDRHILTAAHCVHQYMPPFIFIFPGQHRLNLSIHPSLGYQVTQVSIHERYNFLLQHDLAILTIDQPIRYDSHIRPICLATPNSSFLQTNDELIAIGWGRISAEPGTFIYPQNLQQVKLSYVSTSHPNCSQIFQSITNVHPGQMCAGRSDHHACQGDSGGPLMRKIHIPHKDIYYWEQVGIASKTIDCGWNSTWPDIYINIPYYYDWIMQTIQRMK
ncbi:hypothetical protein I4U23_015542 [Adineta vaga]|nr:hypothetical protein I4U23_015542 [Adineta vaga]